MLGMAAVWKSAGVEVRGCDGWTECWTMVRLPSLTPASTRRLADRSGCSANSPTLYSGRLASASMRRGGVGGARPPSSLNVA
ncbi:MAG: hypothetical protein ACK57O_00745, partial [Planctomyces sp.]